MAAVKMQDGVYAVSSQSLFFNPIPRFRLKSFSGKTLKYSKIEASRLGDLIRIKIDDGQGISGLEFGNSKGGKKVYSMNPETGIVMKGDAGKSLNTDKFNCVAGAPIIDDKGQFVGVASRTDNGFSKGVQMKLFPLSKEEKWQEIKDITLSRQVYTITMLRQFTKDLDNTRKGSRGKFAFVDEDTPSKLIPLYKEKNELAFECATTTGKKKPDMGSFNFTVTRRLAAYYASNAQQAKKIRWVSAYLRNHAKKLYEVNNSSANKLEGEIKKMNKRNPSIKFKL